MTGKDYAGILAPRRPLQGRLGKIAELPCHTSNQPENSGMRHRQHGEKPVLENQAPDDAAGNQTDRPLDGLSGTDLGEKFSFSQPPPNIVGGNIPCKGQDQDEENPQDARLRPADQDEVGHQNRDVQYPQELSLIHI